MMEGDKKCQGFDGMVDNVNGHKGVPFLEVEQAGLMINDDEES